MFYQRIKVDMYYVSVNVAIWEKLMPQPLELEGVLAVNPVPKGKIPQF